jgi:hypothetical protein
MTKKRAQLLLNDGDKCVAWVVSIGITEQDALSLPALVERVHKALKARLGDFIETKNKDIDGLLFSTMPPPRLVPMFEPYAGSGAIIKRLLQREWYLQEHLFACEVRREERPNLEPLVARLWIEDWTRLRKELDYPCPSCGGLGGGSLGPGAGECLTCGCRRAGWLAGVEEEALPCLWRGWPADVVISNPPFSQLPALAAACLGLDLPGQLRYLALLMPIEELAGLKRVVEFLARWPPTGLVLLPWRSWDHVRGCAWFVWERGKPPLNLEAALAAPPLLAPS